MVVSRSSYMLENETKCGDSSCCENLKRKFEDISVKRPQCMGKTSPKKKRWKHRRHSLLQRCSKVYGRRDAEKEIGLTRQKHVRLMSMKKFNQDGFHEGTIKRALRRYHDIPIEILLETGENAPNINDQEVPCTSNFNRNDIVDSEEEELCANLEFKSNKNDIIRRYLLQNEENKTIDSFESIQLSKIELFDRSDITHHQYITAADPSTVLTDTHNCGDENSIISYVLQKHEIDYQHDQRITLEDEPTNSSISSISSIVNDSESIDLKTTENVCDQTESTLSDDEQDELDLVEEYETQMRSPSPKCHWQTDVLNLQAVDHDIPSNVSKLRKDNYVYEHLADDIGKHFQQTSCFPCLTLTKRDESKLTCTEMCPTPDETDRLPFTENYDLADLEGIFEVLDQDSDCLITVEDIIREMANIENVIPPANVKRLKSLPVPITFQQFVDFCKRIDKEINHLEKEFQTKKKGKNHWEVITYV